MQLRDATLLLVDDEPILLEIETEWFSGLAAQVLTANNGAEALKVLEATPVDVILTDVRMPVMDGITLLTKPKRMRRPILRLIVSVRAKPLYSNRLALDTCPRASAQLDSSFHICSRG
jgi:CheY-like chemotaxis protein